MSLVELKALFYDLMAQKQQIEMQMSQVNQQIQEAANAQAAANGQPAMVETPEKAEAIQ